MGLLARSTVSVFGVLTYHMGFEFQKSVFLFMTLERIRKGMRCILSADMLCRNT